MSAARTRAFRRALQTCPTAQVLLDLFEQMVLLRRFESVAQIACRKGETPGLPPSLYRRGSDRRRHLRASAPDRLGDLDASRPRPRAGQGRRPRAASWPSCSARPTASAAAAAAPCISTTARSACSAPTASSAAGIGHAVGIGMSARQQGRDDIGVAFFGDGAANHGAFHEALNFAAVQHAPAVFVCENNLYATATPLKIDHAQPRDRQQGRLLRHARRRGRRQRRLRRLAGDEGSHRARPLRQGPDADRGQDLPHRRPPRGRPGHRHLSHAGGGRRLDQARPDRHVPQAADRGLRRRRRRRRSPRSRRTSRRWCRKRWSSPATRPSPIRRRCASMSMPTRSIRPRRCSRAPVGETRDAGLARSGARRHRRGDARQPAPSSISAKAPASAAAASPTPRTCGRNSAPSAWSTRRSPSRALPPPRVGASATGARTVSDLMFADFAFETAGPDLPAGGQAALHEQRRR